MTIGIAEDGFTSKRVRKALMILSLVMVPFVLSTAFFFVDSYSLAVWNRETLAGPAPITLRGVKAFQFTAQIRALFDVTRVSYLNSSWASILSLVNNMSLPPNLP